MEVILAMADSSEAASEFLSVFHNNNQPIEVFELAEGETCSSGLDRNSFKAQLQTSSANLEAEASFNTLQTDQ